MLRRDMAEAVVAPDGPSSAIMTTSRIATLQVPSPTSIAIMYTTVRAA